MDWFVLSGVLLVLIIPVLDIKDALVVHARRGERQAYRPLETPLSLRPALEDVAEGLRSVYPFPIFYVADLDAIGSQTGDCSAALRLTRLTPAPGVWLDAGFSGSESLARTHALPGVAPVVGSESLTDAAFLTHFSAYPGAILSLDFRGEAFCGPEDVLARSDLWPSRVIVMTLARVGSETGPDFARLAEIKARAGARQVVAAGGVRDATDLRKLAEMGISAALVATSIHNGTLTREVIAGMMEGSDTVAQHR
ncbi:HisA/HisF-related TIM barrel protein [Ciceribacter sp. RN22]|uniref:HisA/HisF-related TIM barrel protein n=1 Tax=Ciceribacter sp. RN22 TaxID=2954932 RepID=UPI002093B212|nr:HisA/HisF-related TIM barrel protein [Ciceribacter sp. RN22]MCO6180568.1 HisA/HisF-related TIM barrel protein [Ciceribacter sp. RN22]